LIKDSKIYRDNKQKGRSHSASEYRRLTSWQTVASRMAHVKPILTPIVFPWVFG
jgi:hypothetical protein